MKPNYDIPGGNTEGWHVVYFPTAVRDETGDFRWGRCDSCHEPVETEVINNIKYWVVDTLIIVEETLT